MVNKYFDLESKMGIEFKDRALLENVFIHRSYLNECKNFPLPANERLEFLGDSVLSLITSVYLFKHYPHLKEGEYTDIKAAIVRTESLAQAARQLSLGRYIFLSKGEEQAGGRDNKNILADCFEALIAAIFLDNSFEAASKFVNQFLFGRKLNYIVKNRLYLSMKSRLQEFSQAKYKKIPQYKILEEKGPEHKRIFKAAVYFNGQEFGIGFGNSKKEAEEEAAKIALENVRKIY